MKNEEMRKMSKEERKGKIQELKLELIKSKVTANKTNTKTKLIKRQIARILTMNNMQKESVDKNGN